MKKKSIVIDHREDGQFFFLSNSFPQYIEYNGLLFSCAEGAFQSSKAGKMKDKKIFCPISGSLAISRGNIIKPSKGWYGKQLTIMKRILKKKFAIPYLRIKLMNTAPAAIINHTIMSSNESLFWGINKEGEGRNKLGVLLVILRKELIKG